MLNSIFDSLLLFFVNGTKSCQLIQKPIAITFAASKEMRIKYTRIVHISRYERATKWEMKSQERQQQQNALREERKRKTENVLKQKMSEHERRCEATEDDRR